MLCSSNHFIFIYSFSPLLGKRDHCTLAQWFLFISTASRAIQSVSHSYQWVSQLHLWWIISLHRYACLISTLSSSYSLPIWLHIVTEKSFKTWALSSYSRFFCITYKIKSPCLCIGYEGSGSDQSLPIQFIPPSWSFLLPPSFAQLHVPATL